MSRPSTDDTPRVRLRRVLAALALAPLVASLGGAAPVGAQGLAATGAVFTASNASDGNAVLFFRRNAAGRLTHLGDFATGGDGSGGGLGNQGGVALDTASRHLFVVNAGSDTVSVFGVEPRGLTLLDEEPSGGTSPISVTSYGDLVYVLNAGGDGNIAGFELAVDGTLSPLAGSIQPLSGAATGPAQIGFSPDGRFLVVTEKGTNTIVTYAVGDDGVAAPPVVTTAEGITPFGFSFGHRGRLLVSEATGGAVAASTVSSYELLSDGTLDAITSALATTQSAACWLVATGNGRYAYVTNTGDDTVTGLEVARDGSLSLLDAGGVTAVAGGAPIDAALSRDGRFLYVLNGADDTLSEYRVGADGSLEPVAQLGGLPSSVNGLTAF